MQQLKQLCVPEFNDSECLQCNSQWKSKRKELGRHRGVRSGFFVPDGHKSTRLARIIFKILITFIELGKIQARLVPGLNFAF